MLIPFKNHTLIRRKIFVGLERLTLINSHSEQIRQSSSAKLVKKQGTREFRLHTPEERQQLRNRAYDHGDILSTICMQSMLRESKSQHLLNDFVKGSVGGISGSLFLFDRTRFIPSRGDIVSVCVCVYAIVDVHLHL